MEEEKADDGAHSAAHIYGLPADSEFANEWYGKDDTGKDNAGKRDDDWEPSGSDSEDDSEDSLAPVKAAGGKLRALGGRRGGGANVFDHDNSPDAKVRVSRARARARCATLTRSVLSQPRAPRAQKVAIFGQNVALVHAPRLETTTPPFEFTISSCKKNFDEMFAEDGGHLSLSARRTRAHVGPRHPVQLACK